MKIPKKLALSLLAAVFLTSPALAAKPVTGTPTIPNSVCLDAGHGGTDPGAVSQDGVYKESKLNLDVAYKVKALLESVKNPDGSNKHTVFMTRTDESQSLDNADRYNYCNSVGAAVLVSVHHNGSSSATADYSTALYSKRSDVDLSNSVLDGVYQALGIERKSISRFQSGVLLKSNMPSTISEGFFVTSTAEQQLLAANYNGRLDTESQGIFSGISNYLNFH